MKTSETIKNILPAFLNVQTQMDSLTKDRANPFANSKYVTLDNILDKLKPILSSNNLILIQNPLTINNDSQIRVGVETRVYHKEGEWFDFGEFLLDFEKGSKMNLAQSAGSLTSYAKRYVLTAIFSIDTNEDTDGVDINKQSNQNYESNYQNHNYQNRQYKQQSNNQNQQQNNDFKHQKEDYSNPPQESVEERIDGGFKSLMSLESEWSIDDIIIYMNDLYKINFAELAKNKQLAYLSRLYRELKRQPKKENNNTGNSGIDWSAANNG